MTPSSSDETSSDGLSPGRPHAIEVERDGHQRQCSAQSRRGVRCRSFAVRGATVCRMHGGTAPQVRAAVERREAERKANALLSAIWDMEADPVTDPVSALQALAGRLQHAANVLGQRLSGDELDGVTAVAFLRVLRELRQALEGMERLDLVGKQVQLEQAKAEQVITAVRVGLGALPELLPEQRDRFLRSFLGSLQGRPVGEGDPAIVVGELG